MAVSMNLSNYRADFMISDAALPQRLEQLDKEQTAQFASILKDFGSMEKTSPVSDSASANFIDEGQSVQSDVKDIPDDVMALARKIVKGDIKIDDVPADKITFELLKALAIVKKLEKLNDKNEDEDEEKEENRDVLFDPADAAVVSQNFAMTLQDQLLLEIYNLIEKYNEEKSEDKVTMLDGISEPMPEYPQLADTLSFPIDAEKDVTDESVFAQIIDAHVETVQQEEETRVNADTFVSSAEVNTAVSETDPELPDGEFKIIENAVKNGEIEKPEVKTEAVAEESVPETSTERTDDRAKAISEELEMLKNAKLGRSAKSTDEEEKPQNEVKPVHAEPLNANSPIVLSGKDGKEIRVSPSDIVAQASKLVEKAISENNDRTEYSLVLNPEELGRITVKLIKAADGAISVTIAAESARTQRILEQNSELMQSNLRSNGVQLESWQTVNESRQETLAQDYNGSSRNPYYRDDDPKQEENSDEKTFAEIIASM